jgi:uncharacterized C2H2 Zn-finger protein
MKCPSCGYTREVKSEWVNEAVLFKSGKNKGKFKEIKPREIRREVGFTEFEEVSSIVDIRSGYDGMMTEFLAFLVCPECRSVTLKEKK